MPILYPKYNYNYTTDLIYEKRFSIYDIVKPFLDENEFASNIAIAIAIGKENLDLTKYTMHKTFDLAKCPTQCKKLNCSNTGLINIECSNPDIELEELKCLSNDLTELSDIKLNNLLRLFCANNKIVNLDKLSQNTPNLKYLNCAGNPITSLDNLPEKLIYLDCTDCEICNLNNIPLTLEILICSYNPITSLDYLPESLIILHCYNCEITQLDNLPLGLNELSCYSNKINKLFNLGKNLHLIKCDEQMQISNVHQDLKIIYL